MLRVFQNKQWSLLLQDYKWPKLSFLTRNASELPCLRHIFQPTAFFFFLARNYVLTNGLNCWNFNWLFFFFFSNIITFQSAMTPNEQNQSLSFIYPSWIKGVLERKPITYISQLPFFFDASSLLHEFVQLIFK